MIDRTKSMRIGITSEKLDVFRLKREQMEREKEMNIGAFQKKGVFNKEKQKPLVSIEMKTKMALQKEKEKEQYE